ncbi:carbohydrate porin [Methylocystis sp. IM3]|uniref:carbohydrate porin n=1 Tax=unclassified Methylocystis TaxID=2625913 RepID=UPI000F9A57F1|nr:MAG: porin [Hyphomicrobiales bacterium]
MARALAAAACLCAGAASAGAVPGGKGGAARAPESASLLTRKSFADAPDGPKALLRRFGIDADVWVTQFFQGIAAGANDGLSRYGGKVDGFLKIDAEKLGLWRGLRVNAQYEHYFGLNINNKDFTLVPVNAAQAFVASQSYHSALSVVVTQQLSEQLSLSVGKFNMMTVASQTPLIGGGGLDTFMNRAFALPSTGIGVASARTVADRLIVSPPYILGGIATLKTQVATMTLVFADPRNAANPRVLQRPFERGVGVVGGVTVPIEIAGLRGFHTLRGGYSNARGFDLDDTDDLRARLVTRQPITKKGFWLASYAVQQYLVASADDPSVGWGLFGLATLSDGNPNPVRWSALAGLAGNNLLPGRVNDQWGVGFFHYGLTTPLLAGLADLRLYRRSEGGVEAFYNWAITPWVRLSGDLQIVEPWNALKPRATYMALRLQTRF